MFDVEEGDSYVLPEWQSMSGSCVELSNGEIEFWAIEGYSDQCEECMSLKLCVFISTYLGIIQLLLGIFFGYGGKSRARQIGSVSERG